MKETRRKFIKTTAAGMVLTAVAPLTALASQTSVDQSFNVFSLSAEDLAQFVGTSFKVSCNGTNVRARLKHVEQVKSVGSRPSSLPRRDAFVAVFDGVDSAVFDQQISVVEHAQLGRMNLILAASGENQLTALFN